VVPLVKGVQKHRIAACIKHYVANNQERNRFNITAEIDERTLREIYMKPYEQIIKKSDPWTVMSCYNRVNGEFGSASRILLQDYLVDTFGFSGFVMTDWGATKLVERPEEGINAGLSLEMPKPVIYEVERMKSAFEQKKFPEERLNELVSRILHIMVKTGVLDTNLPSGAVNTPEHQKIAKEIATAGMVLLKNDDKILPLKKSIKSIAIVGANADKKFGKFLYGGSSAVIPPFEITPMKGIIQYLGETVAFSDDPGQTDVAIVVTGLNHDKNMDAENSDRLELSLPSDEEALIHETVAQNPNTIVVLMNGNPVAMDNWIEKVPAVLEAWYPGMMGGLAIAEVLFGDINPSGKLPITFPKSLEDSPAHKSEETYPGTGPMVEQGTSILKILIRQIFKRKPTDDSWVKNKVQYKEGIYIGYRHFDKENIEPLFPFGFGLSYTEFKLENVTLDKSTVNKDEEFSISLDITNIGDRDGAEVVQVYSADLECSVDRPPKELIGFKKVFLKSNEKKSIAIPLRVSDFAFFDIKTHDWKIESGQYELLIGTSSRNLPFKLIITVA
jgi:beta-glucosidase